jgi:hypothetical protein
MNPHILKKAADDFGININAAIKMRIRYLLALIGLWEDYIETKTDDLPELSQMDALDQIVKLKAYEHRLKAGVKLNSITDEMIEQAREFSIETIIEFQNGKAYAFCHTDKTPSLMLDRKRNRAHCFVCDKDFNAVDTLMERDGYTFIDAVKCLAGGL